jgi:hypothetical protein
MGEDATPHDLDVLRLCVYNPSKEWGTDGKFVTREEPVWAPSSNDWKTRMGPLLLS